MLEHRQEHGGGADSPGVAWRTWNTLQAGRCIPGSVGAALPFPQTSDGALSTPKAHGTNTINNSNGATAGDIRAEISEAGNGKAAANWNIFTPALSGKGLLSQRLSQRQGRGQMPRPHSACSCGALSCGSQKGFLGAISDPPPHNFHSVTVWEFREHRKSGFCGYFSPG